MQNFSSICQSMYIVAIFFSAISEIDENFKGVLVKIREVSRNQLFRDYRHCFMHNNNSINRIKYKYKQNTL